MKTVMIVEDDQSIRDVMNDYICLQFDCKCIYASGNKQAIKVFENEKPDIIFLDLLLDDGDCHEFVKYIRDHHKQLPPIILFSASKNADSVFNELHLHGLLKKPFDLDKLDAFLSPICNLKK
jgi:DNA-binding response OmpR family regulator